MQNLSPEEIKEANKLVKPHQEKLLVRSDKKRAVLLQEFVEILERSEGTSNAIFEHWFSKLAKSNLKMTP